MQIIEEHRDEQGRLHNTCAPAAIYADGRKEYYVHGKLHRVTGPAIVTKEGVAYYLNGIRWSEPEWAQRVYSPATSKCQDWGLTSESIPYDERIA